MFEIINGTGFRLTFPNGLTLSTQFGAESHGDNHADPTVFPYGSSFPKSSTCEVAILNNDNDLITNEIINNNEMIEEKVSFDQWLSIFETVKNYKYKG